MKPLSLALAATLLSLGLLHAQPATVSYQGFLESGGVPVNTPQNLTFALFDAASGGVQVWTEIQNAVPVTDGVYNVALGSVTTLEGVDLNVDLWLEVTVGATVLAPRTKLAGVPYAHTLQVPAVLEGSPGAGTVLQVIHTSVSGAVVSLSGRTNSTDGTGVYGWATATSGPNYGVYGQSNSTDGTGVFGLAGSASGISYGLFGVSQSTNGTGVLGWARASTGTLYGVRGDVDSPDGYAGYFTDGNGVFARGHDNNKPDLILGGTSSSSDDGRLFSDPNYQDSDIWLHSNDAVVVVLNNDNAGDSDADFTIEAFDGTDIFNIDEDGTVTMTNDVIVGTTTVHTSDRHRKEGFAPVDVDDVLREVARLPITRWRYQGQAAAHLGPMAQDFHAAFGLGRGETTIAAVDADGVALAAIQGLYRQLQEKEAAIESLQRINAELHQRLARLEALVAGN